MGKATAEAVLAKRANDNADTGGPYINKTCPPPAAPGKYQCTPDLPFVAFEKWESVTPFVLKDHTEFRPGPPYKVDHAKFKADLEEVKKLGGDGKAMPTTRTPEQSEMGLFWLESSPLKWGRIAQTVANDKKLDLWDSARLLAIMQMGQADGYLAMVSAKNIYQFWRPVTAIHASGDKSWMPVPRHSAQSRLSVWSLHRRWGGSRGTQAVLRHRSDQLQGLRRNDGTRPHLLG